MFVGTIHAYCLRLLQDHVPHFGNFDVLDENRLAGLLSREHKRLELSKLGNKHWRPIFDFLSNADVVENEQIDPPALAGTDFGDCYLCFRQTLERYHFLTFGAPCRVRLPFINDVHQLCQYNGLCFQPISRQRQFVPRQPTNHVGAPARPKELAHHFNRYGSVN